ncbi:hypothetical protein HYH03_011022 [Edaphochlamys debaryana]|uniref:Phosphodiesterase n=1 Tax=Edaphochlamys debaryana TaxID=47281 RepID=A0A836BVG8_9CHLO|nr:hypothetical protein HYH03_011022 [Edaphochlamys debaryana]|eukprot:KAG2490631.1 hypothetical protein HYH03_011022 [Edaphochlamys debaryana]
MQLEVRSTQDRVAALCEGVASRLRQQILSATAPVNLAAALVSFDPSFEAARRLFTEVAPALLAQAGPNITTSLSLIPNGIIRASAGKQQGDGLDVFTAVLSGAVNPAGQAVASRQMTMIGPLHLAPRGLALVVYLPIFIANVSAEETWGMPDPPSATCGAPCAYDPITRTKFWGFTAALVDMLGVIAAEESRISYLTSMNYHYEVVVVGSTGEERMVASSEALPIDPVEAWAQLPNSQIVVRTAPADGWRPAYMAGLVVAVVLLALAIAGSLFAALLSRRRHQILLEALLPKQVIHDLAGDAATLAGGRHYHTDTPAEVLLQMMGKLLEGHLPSIQDVLFVRTALLRQQDVYQPDPLNLRGNIKGANLEADVAQALVQQLVEGGAGSSGGGGAGGGMVRLHGPFQRAQTAGTQNTKSSSAATSSPHTNVSLSGFLPYDFETPHGGILFVLSADAACGGTSLTRGAMMASFTATAGAPILAGNGLLSATSSTRAALLPPRHFSEPASEGGPASPVPAAGLQAASSILSAGSAAGAVPASKPTFWSRASLGHTSARSGRTRARSSEAGSSLTGPTPASVPWEGYLMSPGPVRDAQLEAVDVEEESCELELQPRGSVGQLPTSPFSGAPPSESSSSVTLVASGVLGPASPGPGGVRRRPDSSQPQTPNLNPRTGAAQTNDVSVQQASGAHRPLLLSKAASIKGMGSTVSLFQPGSGAREQELNSPQHLIDATTMSGPQRLTPTQMSAQQAQVLQEPATAARGTGGNRAATQPSTAAAAPGLSLRLLAYVRGRGSMDAGDGGVGGGGAKRFSRLGTLGGRKGEEAKQSKDAALDYNGQPGIDAGAAQEATTCGGGMAHFAGVHPPALPPAALVEEAERLLAAADDWQFNTLRLQEVTQGHALSVLGFFLIQRSGVIKGHHLSPLKLARLLRAVEAGYLDNPYHNATHAADVLQTLHVIIHATQLHVHYLDPLGLLAAYYAAIVHDYAHPGLTSDFLVATSDPLAIRYNDKSPLENHHCAASFSLLQRPELNVLAPLSQPEKTAFRKQVIELVLSTDMKQHFSILSHFNTVHRLTAWSQQQAQPQAQQGAVQTSQPPGIAAHGHQGPPTSAPGRSAIGRGRTRELADPGGVRELGPAPQPVDDTERLLSLQVALKCADIGHLGEALGVHMRWLSVLEEEFFRQGDLERELGLPISPLFDRSKQGVSKSQVGFYDFVALPLVHALASAFPGAQQLKVCFTENYNHWQEALEPPTPPHGQPVTSKGSPAAAK